MERGRNRHKSDFAKNLGPELNNLRHQTDIVARNSFGRDLSSKIAKSKNFILAWIELARGLDYLVKSLPYYLKWVGDSGFAVHDFPFRSLR